MHRMTNALVLSYSVATQKPEVVVEDQRNLLQGNPAHEKVTTRKQAAPAMVINESKERNQFQSSAVNFGYTLCIRAKLQYLGKFYAKIVRAGMNGRLVFGQDHSAHSPDCNAKSVPAG